ncbi:hypothetical protein C2E20_2069 [Micractinium conductrix]|uniref:Uncharacterized protein n=1 Tax=Micractinium conductrix TaxID=554055 RepID=A0A2P6VLW5_9CHLO|nr:hypothetical protein C2E20_2069 [Micractinium conductrix]|eukprot:PSC75092.1 hypothetical protein C2E20_2069 [Micractinium conductrix]
MATVPTLSESRLERRFDRHFASKQLAGDRFGTCVGACLYLSLVPSLAALRRADLCAGAVGCACITLWPHLLSSKARRFYIATRDYLIALHFAFHYIVGAQFARYVRINRKFEEPSSPAVFLAGFVLSSTVLWQWMDALMYRMRFHRFLLAKPFLLLSVLPLELRLCQQTCADMPGQSHYFRMAADCLRLLLAPFQMLPLPLTHHAAADGPVKSCFKVQVFLLVVLAWLLPAVLCHRLEQQMLQQFRSQCGALILPDAEAAADEALAARLSAALAAETAARSSSGAAGASPATAPPAGSSGAGAAGGEAAPGQTSGELLRQAEWRQQELQRRWREQQEQQHQRQHLRRLPGGLGDFGESWWPRWGRAFVVSALVWHLLDTVLVVW